MATTASSRLAVLIGAFQLEANSFVDDAWSARRRLMAGERPTVEEALDAALLLSAPVVVADAGDATNGGAPGDSTELLRPALARADAPRVLLSVRDAAAAGAACAAARAPGSSSPSAPAVPATTTRGPFSPAP